MSVAAQDGAWISARRVVRFDCTHCDHVHTSTFPMNDREIDDYIRNHIAYKHGGPYRQPKEK